ncbi:hypothetical protein [Paenibacillus hubeiensis]
MLIMDRIVNKEINFVSGVAGSQVAGGYARANIAAGGTKPVIT